MAEDFKKLMKYSKPKKIQEALQVYYANKQELPMETICMFRQ